MFAGDFPRYTRDRIRTFAEAFLDRHHASLSIPVPIERIIDNDLRIDITPMPGMRRSFQLDGFTTSDLSTIYVDEYVYSSVPNRYRFTLAHEVGHVVLHGEFYRSIGWKRLADWKRLIQDIPEEPYRFMEWHANEFAGLVLVPEVRLQEQVEACRRRIAEHLPGAERDRDSYPDFLDACLADVFDVSTDVIVRRLRKERS